ncbi:hypothetical protein NL676_019180 [Syzygium grande]|nr:hypothetical protein NL676_019180 [Syzygium grande]
MTGNRRHRGAGERAHRRGEQGRGLRWQGKGAGLWWQVLVVVVVGAEERHPEAAAPLGKGSIRGVGAGLAVLLRGDLEGMLGGHEIPGSPNIGEWIRGSLDGGICRATAADGREFRSSSSSSFFLHHRGHLSLSPSPKMERTKTTADFKIK